MKHKTENKLFDKSMFFSSFKKWLHFILQIFSYIYFNNPFNNFGLWHIQKK